MSESRPSTRTGTLISIALIAYLYTAVVILLALFATLTHLSAEFWVQIKPMIVTTIPIWWRW